MRRFFEDFWRRYRGKITFFSFLRLLSFAQILFWPYAFSKIVNILSNDPGEWRTAFLWAGAMVVNKVMEEFVRLKAKYEIENISSKLQIELATFFAEETELRDGRKTGESVQAIKKAYEDIDVLLDFYRNQLLKLPVNFIIIPIILLRASINYLLLLLVYILLYLTMNYFLHRIYSRRLEEFCRAAEIFWGTAYRKTPEVWREREDGHVFANQIEEQGKELFAKQKATNKINMTRWAVVQSFSSAFIGGMVLFVMYRIINGITPLGTLVLVTSYFRETQGTLGIATSACKNVTRAKVSLKRLGKAVKIRGK